MLESYVKRIEEADDPEDLTFEYVGDWQDLMEEARPDILKQVEELKNR